MPSYVSFTFMFLCFHISCVPTMLLELKKLCLIERADITHFIFFHCVMKFTLYYWVCSYLFILFQKSVIFSIMIRLSKDEGRVDKEEEQLGINTCTLPCAMYKWATLFSHFFQPQNKSHQFPPRSISLPSCFLFYPKTIIS